jgi:hypothetical protein
MDSPEQMLAKLRAVAELYGPDALEDMLRQVRKRAESFPDRERQVKWVFEFTADGRPVLTDVQP